MSELSKDPVRVALRALTHGVYVLSVALQDETEAERKSTPVDDYLIVALVMQCSVEPPRIAFALSPNARILQALRSANGAVLSTLDETQLAAVRRYGAPGGVRRTPVNPARSSRGHPVPPEASHWLSLRTLTETNAGDHLLFVADVTDAAVRSVLAAPRMPTDMNAGSTSAMLPEPTGETSAHSRATSVNAFAPLTLASTGFPYAG